MDTITSIENPSLAGYFKTVFRVLFLPTQTFNNMNLNYYQIISYLIISAWFYALIANTLKNLAPFLMLILAPLSVLPHAGLFALLLYLIFSNLCKSKISLKECFKLSTYIFIAILPLTGIVFIPNKDYYIILALKSLPFIYFIILTYLALSIKAADIKSRKRIQGNVLASLGILFISTIIFSINIYLVQSLSKLLFDYDYVWKFSYH
jgi:hypothetical protein